MNNWTWEASPKKEFTRRRLERCYKLDYEKTPVKTKPEKKMKKRSLYWNFWNVVFAGWLIRYPIQILKGVLFIIFMLIMVSGGFKNIDESEYNNGIAREVISE